jgi:hypothetical protein
VAATKNLACSTSALVPVYTLLLLLLLLLLLPYCTFVNHQVHTNSNAVLMPLLLPLLPLLLLPPCSAFEGPALKEFVLLLLPASSLVCHVNLRHHRLAQVNC